VRDKENINRFLTDNVTSRYRKCPRKIKLLQITNRARERQVQKGSLAKNLEEPARAAVTESYKFSVISNRKFVMPITRNNAAQGCAESGVIFVIYPNAGNAACATRSR